MNISEYTFPRISRNIETTPIRRFSFSPSMRVHVPRSSSYFLARARGLLLFPPREKKWRRYVLDKISLPAPSTSSWLKAGPRSRVVPFRVRIMFSRDSIPRSLRPLSKIFPNSISSIVRTYTVRELTVVYAATWIRKKNRHRASKLYRNGTNIYLPYDCFRFVSGHRSNQLNAQRRFTRILKKKKKKKESSFLFFQILSKCFYEFLLFFPRFLFESIDNKQIERVIEKETIFWFGKMA